MPDLNIAPRNQLLSALLVSTYQRLSPHLKEISLTSGQVVHQSCETITEVYFPQSEIFSSIIVMSDESTTEISAVGNEGMVGLPAVLGNNSLTTNSVVQISGTALKLSADVIRKEFQKGEELQLQLLLYTQAYLAHAVAAATLHSSLFSPYFSNCCL